MRIALLSDVTVELLARLLAEDGHEVWSPPGFGAWLEAALAPSQELAAFGPDEICLLLDDRRRAEDGGRLDAALAALSAAFPQAVLRVPDLAALAADFGAAFFDERMRQLAAMPWSLAGLDAIRRLFVPRKALAVDLDGTLWTGVLGEDGCAGLTADADFQRRLAELKDRGVLLVALSKNEPAEVEAALAPGAVRGQVLTRADFAAVAAGWEPKPAALRKTAARLGLGMDAFVFVDDNPGERAEMRAAAPEVAVADFPPRLETFFPPRKVTAEDRLRTASYRDAAKREAAADAARRGGLSYEDYLAGLEIRTEVHPLRPDEWERVAQLSQRANQFNVRTNRYGVREVERLAQDPARLVLVATSGDRFGELGLVAFVQVLLPHPDDATRTAVVADWVMSCRAMNRRIEFAVERAVEAELARRGVKRLEAEWVRTAKNAPVAGLFPAFGFETLIASDDRATYVRHLACTLITDSE